VGQKTVVFVHGWTCDETSWQEQVPVFEKNYRVITVDLPGHGKSGAPKTKPLSMDIFAQAIEAVRVEAKAGKIVLVGHSMGSPVIIRYARLFPANVAGVVPVDGGLTMRAGAPGNVDRFKGEAGVKAREGMIRGMFGPGATPAIQEHILKMMLGASETTAIQAMQSMSEANPKNDPLPFPMLGVWAGGAPTADAVKQVFPNGRGVNVSGAGHFLMLEKPAEFNKLLADFLPTVKF
jgi:pimeloyl-ACP methyl ester carboxylesterase